MTDIVERLRKWRMWPETSEVAGEDIYVLTQEAAAEIERVRTALQYTVHEYEHAKAETERLRKINTKLQRDLSDRISDIFEHDAEVERLRAARDVALEEAAKVAWEHDDDVGAVIADAIRALKDKP